MLVQLKLLLMQARLLRNALENCYLYMLSHVRMQKLKRSCHNALM